MSGGEPLWRRVAGLYLSGVPIGGRDGMSTRADPAPATHAEGGADTRKDVVLLGEALDLVTLAQGYASPAVPLLLRALIRGVRQMGAAPGEAAPAEAEAAKAETAPANAEPAEETKAEAEAPEAEAAEAPPSEHPAEAEEETAPDRVAALEQQFKDTDQKVVTLTAALGRLVEVLQRRVRDGGGVDRRRFPRVAGGSAKIFIRDTTYEVVNWSRSGFLIRIGEADRFSRGGFDFHFILDLPDESIQFQGRALPVRIERTLLAAEFVSMDEATGNRMAEIAARMAAAPA